VGIEVSGLRPETEIEIEGPREGIIQRQIPGAFKHVDEKIIPWQRKTQP